MKQAVIYTSLTGGYDDLPLYEIIDPDFDYVCFSNDYPAGSKVGQWEIRSIPIESKDKILLSRYAKLMPHAVFPDYEYSIWLDANLTITSPEIYDIIKSKISEGTLWAGVKHPLRDCLYDDALECVRGGKTDFSATHHQLQAMRADGFPTHFGLNENNFILRNHLHPQVMEIDLEWWDIFCRYTRRDQFSLFYIFWKKSFHPTYLLPPCFSTRNFPGITYIPHIRLPFLKRFKRKLRNLHRHTINTLHLSIFHHTL